jgi:hypothetical protein
MSIPASLLSLFLGAAHSNPKEALGIFLGHYRQTPTNIFQGNLIF